MDFIIKKDADKQAVMTYIDRLPNCKQYNIHIETRKSKRSVDQNALYWKWIGIMAEDTGNDKDDLHDFFSQKFIGYGSKRLYGEEVLKKSSTKDLTTQEFSDYLEKVNAFATVELGIILPQPEDVYWSLYEDKSY